MVSSPFEEIPESMQVGRTRLTLEEKVFVTLRQMSVSIAVPRVRAVGLRSALHSSSYPPVDLSLVPTEYHDLGTVFNKDRTLSLRPHHPYDCTIDLLPGAPLTFSRLYNVLPQARGHGMLHP